MALTTAELQLLITAKDMASKELSTVQDNSERMGKAVTAASALATVGLLGMAAGAIKMAADFQHSMSQVGAVAGATKDQMSDLSAAALKIGADTAFSASDAADAMGELAAGGRTVSQILGGEALSAVNLAAAGNYGLADSGRAIATSMGVWSDTTLTAVDVTNRLAGAANASRFGVDDMAQAIASGGGVADTAGISFQDFTTSIAATANAFSSGSDAGTSFKTFITSLTGNSQQAKDEITALGLSFYDAQGAIKPMAAIVQELHDKVGPLSQEEQTLALKTIFGNDAFRTAAGLMKMTGDEFNAMSTKMGNTDSAAIAAQRMDNLSGSFESLKGSVETMAITIGTKALPILTDLAGGATTAVNAFGNLPGSTQALSLSMLAVAAAAPAAYSALKSVVGSVSDLASGAMSAQGKVGILAAGIGALAVTTDLILQKTTGAGLVDRIIGDGGRAEAAKQVGGELAGVLMTISTQSDKVTASTDYLNRAMSDYTAAGGAAVGEQSAWQNALLGSDNRLFGFNVGLSDGQDALKKYEEQVRSGGAAMVANGATVFQLRDEYNKLPPAMQPIFDSSTHVVAAMDAIEASAGKSMAALNAAGIGTATYGVGLDQVATKAAPAMTAMQQLGAALEDSGKKSVTYEDELKALATEIDDLAGHFAAIDPTYAANAVQIAINNAELAKLKETGETYSTTLGMTATQIEAANKQLMNHNATIDASTAAITGVLKPLQSLTGDEGMAGLAAALTATQAPAETVQTAVEHLGVAFAEAKTGGIDKALAGIAQAKEDLKGQPEAWSAIATALGPAFTSTILAGLSDPAQRTALILEMRNLGLQVAEGFRQGIAIGADSAVNEAIAMARRAAGAAGNVLEVNSPSKVMHRMGVFVAQGLANGMLDGTTLVANAAAQLANTIVVHGVSGGGGGLTASTSGGGGRHSSQAIANLHDLAQWVNTLSDDARSRWGLGHPNETRAFMEAGWFVNEDYSISFSGPGGISSGWSNSAGTGYADVHGNDNPTFSNGQGGSQSNVNDLTHQLQVLTTKMDQIRSQAATASQDQRNILMRQLAALQQQAILIQHQIDAAKVAAASQVDAWNKGVADLTTAMGRAATTTANATGATIARGIAGVLAAAGGIGRGAMGAMGRQSRVVNGQVLWGMGDDYYPADDGGDLFRRTGSFTPAWDPNNYGPKDYHDPFAYANSTYENGAGRRYSYDPRTGYVGTPGGQFNVTVNITSAIGDRSTFDKTMPEVIDRLKDALSRQLGKGGLGG